MNLRVIEIEPTFFMNKQAPFCMILSADRLLPCWLESVQLDNDDQRKRWQFQMAWGKPFVNQTLDNWRQLDEKNGTWRAAAVGVYELLRQGYLPKNGKQGSVIEVHCGKLMGVWADSAEAAKVCLREQTKVIEPVAASLGLSKESIYDFEML